MPFISDDPTWWPTISLFRGYSYFQVASLTVLVYDWALTFGQECELVWRQRWSIMSVIYLSMRYVAIPYTILSILSCLPSVSVTDKGCIMMYFVRDWIGIIVNIMLGVIMITRLYVMYQQSRKMLIFLLVIFIPIQITTVVIVAMQPGNTSGEEYILSGIHTCGYNLSGDAPFLNSMTWVLATAWEVLALFLSIWIAVKHFREIPQPTRLTANDCFTILIKTHAFYFASVVAASSFELGYLSPKIAALNIAGTEVYYGISEITQLAMYFVLGPRLILGVREHNAKLVADSDEGPAMTSIAFQERVHITTDSGV